MYGLLEDRMQMKCESEDPTWTALLASYLQTAGCLRLGHIIRRSVPVERYEGWILFFCKKGKQKHNRQGFRIASPFASPQAFATATPISPAISSSLVATPATSNSTEQVPRNANNTATAPAIVAAP